MLIKVLIEINIKSFLIMYLDISAYKHILSAALFTTGFIFSIACNDLIFNQAKKDSFEAQFAMAQHSFIQKNFKEGLIWVVKAQKHKNEECLLKLSSMLLGHSNIILNQKAASILHQASRLPSSKASYKLAQLYKNGVGVNMSSKHSLRWLNHAAKLGHVMAQLELSKAIKKTSIEKSNYWLQQAALNGDVNAQINYTKILLKKDPEKATNWLLSSSSQNNSSTIVKIALSKEINDLSFTTDQTIKLLKRAHELGNIKATANLVKYLNDIEPKNALKMAHKAANAGELEGKYQYAVILEASATTIKQTKKVVDLYRSAANRLHPLALYNLGTILLKNPALCTVPQEPYLSIFKAADLGVAEAQFQIGYWFYTGMSNKLNRLKKNPTLALNWYLKAAQQNHAEACYEVGFFYENGIGTSINIVKALKWYKLAKKNGFYKAKKALLRVSKKQSLFQKLKRWWNAD